MKRDQKALGDTGIMAFLRQINPAIFGTILFIVLLFAVGALFADRFATVNNMVQVYRYSAALMFVSLAQTIVVLIGGIDLSIGAMISLAAVFTSGLINGQPNLVWPVVIGILFFGIILGLINGSLITFLRVSPLIITLGMAAILQGIALLYTMAPIGSVPPEFQDFAFGDVAGIPIGPTVAILLLVCTGFILKYTRFGRQVYAVGGSPNSAKLVGISVQRVTLAAFAFSGFAAALAAVYLVSLLGTGNPLMGQGYELTSITPVVVGGTSLSGGKGGVWGTLFGVFLVGLLNNVLNFLGISTFYQWVAQGLIILIAVSIFAERKEALA
jgi:ribose transport system permease protein